MKNLSIVVIVVFIIICIVGAIKLQQYQEEEKSLFQSSLSCQEAVVYFLGTAEDGMLCYSTKNHLWYTLYKGGKKSTILEDLSTGRKYNELTLLQRVSLEK